MGVLRGCRDLRQQQRLHIGQSPRAPGCSGCLPPRNRLVQLSRSPGWAAGTYVLTFDAAQRDNFRAHEQNFSVPIDGNVVGTFTPTGTTYQSYSTAAFTVTAGSHTITFQGLDSAGGDNTAFLDAVTIS